MLEEITGCKLMCPKETVPPVKIHVTTPDLALLRYGYNGDIYGSGNDNANGNNINSNNNVRGNIYAHTGSHFGQFTSQFTGHINSQNYDQNNGYINGQGWRKQLANNITATLPDIACKLFLDMKIKPAWKVQQTFLSVRENGNAVMTHSLLRVMHAYYILSLHKLLTTMHITPIELEQKTTRIYTPSFRAVDRSIR